MFAVESANLESGDIDILKAAPVNRNGRRMLRRGADHGDAAGGAEVLSARDRAPGVGAKQPAWGLQPHLLRRDIPMQEAGSRAD